MGAPCGKPTHSTSAPTHSLCEPSSVQCSPLSHAGTHGASRARSPPPIHPGEGCSHFFFFLLSSSPPGIADFVFVFVSLSVGVVSGWYQQSCVFSSSSSLRDTTDRRGVARGRAHHDGEQREGILFFFFFNFFISFFTFYFGGEAVRFQTKKINKISLLESATATCWRSGYVLEGFFTAQVRWGIKNRQLADGCRFRGEESLPLRKVSDGETLTVEFVQQINYWSVLMDSICLDHPRAAPWKFLAPLNHSFSLWDPCWESVSGVWSNAC